ncbi:MAG: Hpt domain-containing protein [Spirochaetes bacterium]|nr:Hpt domain-containing protein [Spirochaetota bacterium]
MEKDFKFNKDILDIEELSREFDNDREMIKSLINDFINDITGQMPLFSEAILKNDYDFLLKETHKMKGCAFSIFANKIAETLFNMELSSKKKDINDLLKSYQELQNDLKILTYYLKMFEK